MTRGFALVAALTVVLMSSTGAIPVRSHHELRTPQVKKIGNLSLEFVGQFQNSPPGVTPATHSHYGYLSYIQGLSVFAHAPQEETTALFTFFAEAATLHVIANGPLRVITRVGTLTIYLDRSTNGSFANPETFRDGTPVLVAACSWVKSVRRSRPPSAARETCRVHRQVSSAATRSADEEGRPPTTRPPSPLTG